MDKLEGQEKLLVRLLEKEIKKGITTKLKIQIY